MVLHAVKTIAVTNPVEGRREKRQEDEGGGDGSGEGKEEGGRREKNRKQVKTVAWFLNKKKYVLTGVGGSVSVVIVFPINCTKDYQWSMVLHCKQ